MSKYAEEFSRGFKDIGQLKAQTREILERNGELACEEYHDAKSLEKLKKIITTSK